MNAPQYYVIRSLHFLFICYSDEAAFGLPGHVGFICYSGEAAFGLPGHVGFICYSDEAAFGLPGHVGFISSKGSNFCLHREFSSSGEGKAVEA